MDIKRRKMLAIAGVAASTMLLAARAQADTAFTSFAFPATGFPTSRTAPDRWTFYRNVKDFGAVGTGAFDDRAAIQAAMDSTPQIAHRYGMIFFPEGIYQISSSLTIDNSFAGEVSMGFLGVLKASKINGTFNDFLLKRDIDGGPWSGIVTVEKLFFENGHATGGCIKLGDLVGGAVRDCTLSGNKCLFATSAAFNINQSFTVNDVVFQNNGTANAIGLVVGGNCIVSACDISGFKYAIMAYGFGLNVIGGRIEVCGKAFALGIREDETIQALQNFFISGTSVESCGIGVDFLNAGAGTITGVFVHGFESRKLSYIGGAVSSFVNGAGATSGATFTGVITNTGVLTVSGISGTLQPGTDYISGTGVLNGTFLDSQLTGTPGGNGTYQLSSIFAYGFYYRSTAATDVTTQNCQTGGQQSVASFAIENTAGNRAGLTFISCRASNGSTLGGTTWQLPTQAYIATWIDCDVNPIFTFAGLPPSGANRLEGNFYYITDANTSTIGNAVTAGGGATRGLVIWNGSQWTLMSK